MNTMSSQPFTQLQGIPLELFSNQKGANNYKCALCGKIARVPRLVKCSDANGNIDDHEKRCVCMNCLAPYDMNKKCPFHGHEDNRIVEIFKLSSLKRLRYDKLELKCEYSKSNCPWKGKLKGYEQHKLNCEYGVHSQLQSNQLQYNNQFQSQFSNNNNNNDNTGNNGLNQPISFNNTTQQMNSKQYSHTPQPPLHKQQLNNKQYTSSPNLFQNMHSPPNVIQSNNNNNNNKNNNKNNNNNKMFNNNKQNNSSNTSENDMQSSYVMVPKTSYSHLNDQNKEQLINRQLYILYKNLESLQSKAEQIVLINKTFAEKYKYFVSQLNEVNDKVNNITSNNTFINNNQYQQQQQQQINSFNQYNHNN